MVIWQPVSTFKGVMHKGCVILLNQGGVFSARGGELGGNSSGSDLSYYIIEIGGCGFGANQTTITLNDAQTARVLGLLTEACN